MVEKSTPPHGSNVKRQRAFALLTGGLVLGVGAVVTLAAWNDSEFATADFASGTFEFQGSTDGSTWADHAVVGDAAQLTFSQGFDNLSPDENVYAPFALRLTAATTLPATLSALPVTVSGDLDGQLAFASVATTTFGCDEAAFASGTAIPTSMQPGDVVNLCLRVAAASDLTQGDTGTAVWQWDATTD